MRKRVTNHYVNLKGMNDHQDSIFTTAKELASKTWGSENNLTDHIDIPFRTGHLVILAGTKYL